MALRTARRSPTMQTALSTALVATSFVTLLIAGGLELAARYRSEREAVRGRQLLSAQEAARAVSAFVGEKLSVLEATAWVADPDRQSPDGRRMILQSLIGLDRAFVRLAMTGIAGDVVADVSRLPGEGEAFPDLQPALAGVLLVPRFVCAVHFDAVTNEPRVVLAVPVLNAARQRRGALLAEVNLKFMWDAVDSCRVGEQGYAYVVDRRGRLIAYADAARVLRGETVSALPPVAAFLSASNQAPAAADEGYLGIAGLRVVGAYVPLATPDWAVVTELPRREAYAGTVADGVVAAVVLVLMTCGAGVLGALFARRLARPVVNLRDAAHRVTAGVRGLSVPVDGPREVRELAAAFNGMTRRLEGTLQDLEGQVDEVKRAEDALRESELRYRNLASASFEGIALTSNGIVLDVNEQFAELIGYERAELIGLPIVEVVTPANRQMVRDYIAEGRTEVYENVLVHKDGHAIEVEVRARFSMGTPPIRLTAVRDVTARRRAEAALRESEERFRLVLDATNDGLWDWNVSSDTYYFSPHFYTMLGYEPDEFASHADGFVPLIHPDDAVRAVAAVRAAVDEREPFALEYRARTRDGQWMWIMSRGRAVAWDESGRAARIVGAHTDITARREAEAAHRAQEYFLAKSQEVGGLGSYNFDLRTVTWRCTPKLDEILGIDARYPRTADSWLALVHPDDLDQLKRHLLEEVLAQRQRFDGEYRIIRAGDGRVRWVHGLGELEVDDRGSPVEMFGTIQDVTARHEAEEEIRRLNEELEERVRLRTAQLEAANRELEAFAYSVSHDLRAPLRAIDGYSQILLEDYLPLLAEEGQRVCGVVRDETRRMSSLIDDLLAFSRYGRAAIDAVPLDMAAIVRAVFADLLPPESAERIDLVVGDLPAAAGDAVLVRQVWTNLVANAIKFSSKRVRARIEIAGVAEARRVVYTIRDNGAGFDMQYADRLFGVFQRLHSAREFEGTGVGLAIVQRIVRRHGGDVWAEGEPDRGAVFHFTLPRVDRE